MTKYSFTILTFLITELLGLFVPNYCNGQSPKRIKTIIVDAGHGGKDDGAHGDYEGSLNSKEKNITLAIALKLVDELKKDMPGVNVIPTRTTDVYQSPREKAEIANNNHGDIFICIHADAVLLKTGSRVIGHRLERYTAVTYKGKGRKRKKITITHTRRVPVLQYYKIPTDRRGTSAWIFSSQKVNDKIDAIEKSDLLFNADDNDSTFDINEDSPEWRAEALLYTQTYFKKSYRLALDIENEIDSIGRPALGVNQRQKGIWVLQATQMPAVLIETGFISNYDDERYLNSERGQRDIAKCIARAIVKYKNQVETLQAN